MHGYETTGLGCPRGAEEGTRAQDSCNPGTTGGTNPPDPTNPVSLPCYSHRESGVNFGLGTDRERQSTSKGWGPCAKRKPERRVVCGCGDIFV